MAALRVWDIYAECVWQQGNNCGTNLMSRATTAAACLTCSAGGTPSVKSSMFVIGALIIRGQQVKGTKGK